MIENKFERIKEDDDPNRCHGITSAGQCRYIASEKSKFCAMHGGNQALESQNKQEIKNYRLTKWRVRVQELAESGGVKSLREEIGILCMMLEETLNMCNDKTELLLYSSKISDLVVKIEKLVTSCNRLENQMGKLLDKSAALHLAGQMVGIITEHITDENLIDIIANDIAKMFLKAGEIGGNIE